MIGRKIDCPKCKYRFVVEDPGDDEEADEETEQPAKKSKGKPEEAITAQRPGGPKIAGKPGVKKSRGDADEKKGRRKAAGRSPKLVLGVALALVGIVLLGAVGYFIFGGSGEGGSSASAGGGGGSGATAGAGIGPGATDAGPGGGGAEPEKKEARAAAAQPDSSELATNLLPNDADMVVNLNFREVLGSPIGRAALEGPGAFQQNLVDQKLGFRLTDLDRILIAANSTQDWQFSVLHSSKPFPVDAVKAAFQVKPGPDSPIQGQDYFLSSDVGKILAMLFQQLAESYPGFKPPQRSVQVTTAVRFSDPQTLVLADLVPMKNFLKVNGRPELKTPLPSAEPALKPAAGGEGGPGPEALTPGRGGPGDAGGPGGPPGGMSARGDADAGPGGRGGRGGAPGMAGGSGDADSGVQPSRLYLTIEPALKQMLDRLESKEPVLLSVALNMTSILASPPAKAALALAPAAQTKEIRDLHTLGLAVALKDGATGQLGLEGKTLDAGRAFNTWLEGQAPELAKALSQFLETKFEFVTQPPEGQGNPAFPQGPGGVVGPGGMMPGGPGGVMPGGPGGVPLPGGRLRGGLSAPARGEGGPGPGEFPGGQFGPGGGGFPGVPRVPETPASSTVQVERQDKTVVLTIHYLMDQKAYDKMMALIQPQMRQFKGRVDMVGGQNRLHDLAEAVRNLQSRSQFPRGTLERDLPSTRYGRPYPPDLRISWMAELLPYLGQGDIYQRINRKRAWRDPENVGLAATLIPQFVDSQYPQNSFWVHYPGMKEITAATHFVGLAGIGLDAAEYSPNDPAQLPKLGILGYDRETRLSDVADGLGNTILMAQVPPTFKRPWMASGGSTVQGVPETKSVQPFVSTQSNGKKGTFVIMADGAVRFVSADISDDVFKALVTIKGGETVFVNREAPLVPKPDGQQAELKAQPAAALPPPAPAAVPPASPPVPPADKKGQPDATQPPVAKPGSAPEGGGPGK